MTKKLFYITFLLCFVFGVDVRAAGIKLDGLNFVQKILGSVCTSIDSALTQVDTAAEEYKSELTGKPIPVAAEKAKAYVEKLREEVEAGKESYSDASSTNEDDEENVKSKKKLSLTTLKKQFNEWKENFEEYKKGLVTKIQGKLSAIKKNRETQEQLCEMSQGAEKDACLAQLAVYEQEQAAYEAKLASAQNGEESAFESDEAYQKMKKEGNSLKEEVERMASAAVDKVKGIGAKFIQKLTKRSKADNTAAYKGAIDEYFIAPSEPINEENVERVNKARRLKLKKDIANVFVQYMIYLQKLAQIEENLEKAKNNVIIAQTEINRYSFANEMNIDDMELIQDDVVLEIARMRLQASQDLMKQGYKLNNPDKDPSEYDLDHQYELTDKDIKEGKRS